LFVLPGDGQGFDFGVGEVQILFHAGDGAVCCGWVKWSLRLESAID
jgi:hypothetical protein